MCPQIPDLYNFFLLCFHIENVKILYNAEKTMNKKESKIVNRKENFKKTQAVFFIFEKAADL